MFKLFLFSLTPLSALSLLFFTFVCPRLNKYYTNLRILCPTGSENESNAAENETGTTRKPVFHVVLVEMILSVA